MRSAAALAAMTLGLLLGVTAFAQEPSLGDVARASKARAAASQQKVLTNADLTSKPGFYRMRSASYATIPPVRVSFLVPVSKNAPGEWADLYAYPVAPQQSVVFQLGPFLKSAEDFDCAEARVLGADLTKRFGLRNLEKLFQTKTEIDGMEARITNFSALSVAGPQRGVVVLIAAPAQIITASCIYPQASFDPADALCQNAIDSVSVEVPEHFRLWGGNGEWVQ